MALCGMTVICSSWQAVMQHHIHLDQHTDPSTISLCSTAFHLRQNVQTHNQSCRISVLSSISFTASILPSRNPLCRWVSWIHAWNSVWHLQNQWGICWPCVSPNLRNLSSITVWKQNTHTATHRPITTRRQNLHDPHEAAQCVQQHTSNSTGSTSQPTTTWLWA